MKSNDEKTELSYSLSAPLRAWCLHRGYVESRGLWHEVATFHADLLRRPMEYLETTSPEFHRAILQFLSRHKRVAVGLCFPQESPRECAHSGWIFLHLTRTGSKSGRGLVKFKIRRGITAEYAGERDLLERIPELAPLRDKTVAVVGLGCVGAPSVMAFAQAGVAELRLLDCDHISPGTACRWPLGMSFAGHGKVAALAAFVRDAYPLTVIGTSHYPVTDEEAMRVRLGSVDARWSQRECLNRLLDGADLLYDASAEYGINHLLSVYARKRGIPYIAVASRAGGWGGSVIRVRPDADACLICYHHDMANYDPDTDEGIACLLHSMRQATDFSQLAAAM